MERQVRHMDLTTMKNIGAEMKRKLEFIGISNSEELSSVGSKEAYLRLKFAYPEICLVHLYALQGAIDNLNFNMLSAETKNELKEFCDNLR